MQLVKVDEGYGSFKHVLDDMCLYPQQCPYVEDDSGGPQPPCLAISIDRVKPTPHRYCDEALQFVCYKNQRYVVCTAKK